MKLAIRGGLVLVCDVGDAEARDTDDLAEELVDAVNGRISELPGSPEIILNGDELDAELEPGGDQDFED